MQYLQEGDSGGGRLLSERPAEATPDGHLRLVPPVEVLHDGQSEAVGWGLVLRFSLVLLLRSGYVVTSLEKFVFASHQRKPKIRNKACDFPKPITSQTLLSFY